MKHFLNSLSIIMVGLGLIFNSVATMRNTDYIDVMLQIKYGEDICKKNELNNDETELCNIVKENLEKWKADKL